MASSRNPALAWALVFIVIAGIVLCVIYLTLTPPLGSAVAENRAQAEIVVDLALEETGFSIDPVDKEAVIEVVGAGEDTGYLPVVLEEGTPDRVYKAYYKVENNMLEFFIEKEENIFIKIK